MRYKHHESEIQILQIWVTGTSNVSYKYYESEIQGLLTCADAKLAVPSW